MAQHPVLRERAALCDLFDEVGPDAPTWCGEWSTHQLAAHLWARENRPDAGPGLILGGFFARHTRSVEESAARRPYGDLVEALRDGPPLHWIGRWKPDMDAHEWFVHHEDVRRARGDQPRSGLDDLEDHLWTAIGRMRRLLVGELAVGLTLRTPEGRERIVNKGEPMAVMTAPAGELMLRLFGRPVEVTLEGDPAAVAAVESASMGI